MRIETLLTDLDGVIRIWSGVHPATIEAQFNLPEGGLLRTAFEPALLQKVITGQISDEAWRTHVADQLKEAFPEVDAVKAVAVWSSPAGEIDPEALGVIRQCREKIPVGLITNATSRLRSDLTELGILDEFDAIINSSEIGVAKPDAVIFQKAVETLKAQSERTLFIDDKPANVEGARKAGLIAHVYEGPAHLIELLKSYEAL